MSSVLRNTDPALTFMVCFDTIQQTAGRRGITNDILMSFYVLLEKSGCKNEHLETIRLVS